TQTVAGTGTASPLRAQVGVDPGGNAVIVWERREGTAVCCLHIEAAVRFANGTLGSTAIVSAQDQDGQEPQVAIDSNSHAFAVWQEQRNGLIHAAIGP